MNCTVLHLQKTATAVAHCKQGNGLIKVNGRPLDQVEPVILRAKVRVLKWWWCVPFVFVFQFSYVLVGKNPALQAGVTLMQKTCIWMQNETPGMHFLGVCTFSVHKIRPSMWTRECTRPFLFTLLGAGSIYF